MSSYGAIGYLDDYGVNPEGYGFPVLAIGTAIAGMSAPVLAASIGAGCHLSWEEGRHCWVVVNDANYADQQAEDMPGYTARKRAAMKQPTNGSPSTLDLWRGFCGSDQPDYLGIVRSRK